MNIILYRKLVTCPPQISITGGNRGVFVYVGRGNFVSGKRLC